LYAHVVFIGVLAVFFLPAVLALLAVEEALEEEDAPTLMLNEFDDADDFFADGSLIAGEAAKVLTVPEDDAAGCDETAGATFTCDAAVMQATVTMPATPPWRRLRLFSPCLWKGRF
jgi:hypothetical protein